jgi:hypothetical protein
VARQALHALLMPDALSDVCEGQLSIFEDHLELDDERMRRDNGRVPRQA